MLDTYYLAGSLDQKCEKTRTMINSKTRSYLPFLVLREQVRVRFTPHARIAPLSPIFIYDAKLID